MKRNVLILGLIAILALFCACNSDSNHTAIGIQGNIAKNPVSGIKLDLYELNSNKLLASTISDQYGNFFFPTDPSKNYVVKIGSLAGAKTMTQDGPVDAIDPDFQVGKLILVPRGNTAQFNLAGLNSMSRLKSYNLNATLSPADADTLMAKYADYTLAGIINLASLSIMANKIDPVKGILVNVETFYKGRWSPEIEFVYQLAIRLGFTKMGSFFDAKDLVISQEDIDAAYDSATKIAAKYGLNPPVSEQLSNKIVASDLVNTVSTLFDYKIRGNNKTAYTLNASAFGYAISHFASAKETAVKASEISRVTINPANQGISVAKTQGHNLSLEIKDSADGSYAIDVFPSFAQGTIPGLFYSFVISLSDNPVGNKNASLAEISKGNYVE